MEYIQWKTDESQEFTMDSTYGLFYSKYPIKCRDNLIGYNIIMVLRQRFKPVLSLSLKYCRHQKAIGYKNV